MGALVLALLALAFAVVLVLALLALASAVVLALALLALVFALAAGVIGAGHASPLGKSALAARRPLRSAFRQGTSVKCCRCGDGFRQCAETDLPELHVGVNEWREAFFGTLLLCTPSL